LLAAASATASQPEAKRAALRDVRARDGTHLYVKEWGDGAPVVFVHSWGLNADMWQYQTVELAERGLRCITYDRRGHGRSDQPSDGYDMDTLADDLATVIDALDLRDATLVGHSMGGGEIVRYLSRHGAKRVARTVLLAPTTPCLKKSADNPEGVPAEAFDAVRLAWRADFPKWIVDNTPPFFTKETSAAMQQWGIAMMQRMSLPIAIACNRAMVDADFREELRGLSTPMLLIHGDADASAPLALTGARTAKLVRNCDFRVYEGAPHGLFLTHAARANADIAEFVARA
jgi:pimeloyl-ACP methyl ester carboxylesterase